MAQPVSTTPEPANSPHGGERHVTPRSDLLAGLAWMALGAAILIGSVQMDRLERQGINPVTVPGLLPGLLGIVMLLLGFLLAMRSWRRGALGPHSAGASHASGASIQRIVLVLGLCTTFAVVLVGHGLPFWAAGALFVTVAILSLQHAQRVASGLKLGKREVFTAALIGLGAGTTITLVFQEIFLVRLP